MSLANERITVNPLEESSTNVPLELNGVTRGLGIQIATQGSAWTPAATETPQLAQSVDTEGGLNIATTIGMRSSPVLKFGVVEPLDPAATNYILNPQCIGTTGYQQNAATGASTNPIIRDLIGFDYALLQACPGTNTSEGINAINVPVPSLTTYTAGVWIKGANGGENIKIHMNEVGGSTVGSITATLTTSWQWLTVSGAPVSNPELIIAVAANTETAMYFYVTGFCLVTGSSLLNGFDGTTPGCSWQGPPNGSRSSRPAAGGPRLTAIMGDLEAAVKQLSLNGGTVRRILANSLFRVTYDVTNAQLSWDDTEFTGAGIAQGTITFTCQPYGRGPEMTTVTDSFNPLITGNYIVDDGSFNNFTWGSSGLIAATNLTTENNFLSQASEYPLYSAEVQATFTPGATITGFAGGVIVERSNAQNYLRGMVFDNGSSSVLRLDKVVNGSLTGSLLSTTLGSRISNGTPYTIRIRTQRQNNNDNVYVEYFADTTTIPITGVPTNTLGPYVITDAVFAADTPGLGGIIFTPQTAGATCTNLIISPYLARERTLPVLRFGLAGVPGTVPGLGRMDISDCSGNNQLWGVWGQKEQSISTLASTTDLYYEAEALTPVNGATIVTGVSGASNGEVVQISTLPAGAWVSMLSLEISSGSLQMTHTGSYQVWARCYASTGTPSFQLLWGEGSLSIPTTNALTTLPATSGFYLLDLGMVQLPVPPQGTAEWFGVIQALSGSGLDVAQIDCLFLQPVDDGGAVMEYVSIPPASAISTELAPTAAFSTTGVGTVAWTNPTNVEKLDNQYADCALSSGNTSYWLKATEFDFGLPSGATITGIQAQVYWIPYAPGSISAWGWTLRLVKAGTIQSHSSSYQALETYGSETVIINGDSTDLWGGSWAYSDINNSGFGLAFSAINYYSTEDIVPLVDYMTLTVYYTLGSGLTIAQDAVIYAGQTAEVASDYAYRINSAASTWGPIGSYTGQYMKVPSPAYYDGIDTVLVKASRNPITQADTGIDAIQAQVSITPRYAQIPDA